MVTAVRGIFGAYSAARTVRTLLLVLFLFIVVSVIPIRSEGEWDLSQYVYRSDPGVALGFTEEGWRNGFGKPDAGKTATDMGGIDEGASPAGEPSREDGSVTHGGKSRDKDKDKTDNHTAGSVDSKTPYAYVFYATEDAYACGVLINIDRLQQKFKTKHKIFVLVTRDLSKAYLDAFNERRVTVSIQTAPRLPASSAEYYKNCLVKMLAFKMHHIDPSLRRVLIMDSDQLVQRSLDDLFSTLPEADLAAPRAYWQAGDAPLSSTFMLINLSERVWTKVEYAMEHIQDDKYDMDLVNELFGKTALVLPGQYITINSHWEDWNLPSWYTPDEDFSKIKVEKTEKADANAEIAGEHVDDVAGHAGHNFHEAPENAQRHWRNKREETDSDASAAKAEAGTAGSSETEEALVQSPPSDDEKEEEKPLLSKEQREHYDSLYKLYPDTQVLHFFALGKPWVYSMARVHAYRPEAHPVFYQQFKEWREEAMKSCPPGLVDAL